MKTVLKQHSDNVVLKATRSVPVLHIIKSLGRGGAETLLPETLHQHNKQKYQFHYIYFLPWKYQMVGAIEKAGGTVTCLSAKNNIAILRKVFQIVRYVKKHKIQLIHCHLPWAGIVGRLVGILTGVPVIYTEHNKWERYHKLTYWLNKFSFSSQQKVIAVSGDVAKSIQSHYKGHNPQVQVVANGVDIKKFSPEVIIDRDVRKELGIPASATVIGLACVFRKQKRVPVWLEIAQKLRSQFSGTHFIIVGDGVLKDEIQTKANELNTHDYVHFVGMQTEIRPYLKAMDVFMMSSEFEGLPIALMEAMSMGCMPASTSAGGIGELINDNVNGVLVPVNEPMQLVSRLSDYLSSPGEIKAKAVAARETIVKGFSMQKMVSEIETIYDNILNQRS
ncbi:glycosyltransferase [Flavisolibacter tropicus]|uniref:Glycosyl transferase family 1 n=1 Tax=Flavisolibacter tropicus TaxID=1492898 RepID=A0A172U0S2_9BACT|nr:glycosyltransferase [Flavisolibacter tropicus]ANE52959.1 glycosyl transferase family 1 [Flavisolibacter tropicus]